MLWRSKAELEKEGRPSLNEIFWALAATPLLLFQIVGCGVRIFRGLRGEPLQVSSWFEIDVFLSDPSWSFAGGVTMYMIFIAFWLLLLWVCVLQIQRWLYWRSHI